MKKNKSIIALAIMVAVIGLSMAGCASFATNQDVPQKTVPILAFVSGGLVPTGEEIASYTIFIGIALGYDDFVEAVKGKNYDVVWKNYMFFSKVSAIAK